MTDFMPEGYEEPKSKSGFGTYFKLNDENKNEQIARVRIMGSFKNPESAIMGWESWTAENKPVRFDMSDGSFDNAEGVDRDGSPKHFWAIQIYNHTENEVQIWGITQRTIQRAIRKFSENPKYGAPSNYDIEVTRSGHGLKTEYNLIAEPPEPPSAEIVGKMEEAKIDVRAMFADEGRGLNPFGALSGETDGIPF